MDKKEVCEEEQITVSYPTSILPLTQNLRADNKEYDIISSLTMYGVPILNSDKQEHKNTHSLYEWAILEKRKSLFSRIKK